MACLGVGHEHCGGCSIWSPIVWPARTGDGVALAQICPHMRFAITRSRLRSSRDRSRGSST
jgi:hypothetical protein